jgi:ribonuclease P/MRP protein subunit POP5
MAMKIKPLLPSLREKKRYLVFEIISEHKVDKIDSIETAILNQCNKYLGEIGMAKAGLLFLKDKFNKESQKGIIRVNNKMLDNLKTSLCFIKNIGKENVIIKSVGVSGILKKAQDKFITI